MKYDMQLDKWNNLFYHPVSMAPLTSLPSSLNYFVVSSLFAEEHALPNFLYLTFPPSLPPSDNQYARLALQKWNILNFCPDLHVVDIWIFFSDTSFLRLYCRLCKGRCRQCKNRGLGSIMVGNERKGRSLRQPKPYGSLLRPKFGRNCGRKRLP